MKLYSRENITSYTPINQSISQYLLGGLHVQDFESISIYLSIYVQPVIGNGVLHFSPRASVKTAS